MKRYFLSFLAAYAASCAAFLGMFFIGLTNWFMTDTPLWFDVLCIIAVALPLIALGEVFGRLPKSRQVTHTGRYLLILLATLTVVALLSACSDAVRMLSWPGLLLGNAIQTMLGGGGYWDGVFIILGNLMVPVLFHIGWRWGSRT